MKLSSDQTIFSVFEQYAEDLRAKYAVLAAYNPEDQLKGPLPTLIENMGGLFGIRVVTVTEVQESGVGGRPDIGVSKDRLLVGHVELKAPGKGANPERFTGADKSQWRRFQDLPNLIYTDGNEWALYRFGECQGNLVRPAADIVTKGRSGINDSYIRGVTDLLSEFFLWQPQVPTSPRALADLIAPICRLLRSDVHDVMRKPESYLAQSATDWRKLLFPDSDDDQFADAYAQTLTYGLLLARFSDTSVPLDVESATKTVRRGHALLADALKVLGDERVRAEIAVSVNLLERIIAAVDPTVLQKRAKGDPWLYFYEDFLQSYDSKLRQDRGAYYTPVEAVQAQVRLTARLLEDHFDAEYAFVDPKVVTLDPAVGTGTYILAALAYSLDRIANTKGAGIRASAATNAAKNMYAFELLVGPYAVAHLRLTQKILAEGGQLPSDGVHVYLTDTLESPNQPPADLGLLYRALTDEHIRALKVKAKTPVIVCIGNPPYDRQTREEEEKATVKLKGGWVRFGDDNNPDSAILRDFTAPLEALGLGVHAQNLFNDYVYFWRWALWKVFETKQGPGIICFITASSYIRGPGFAGMRKVMRQTFDNIWILDLEGDNVGTRKTENIFDIETPVCICIGIRRDFQRDDEPAVALYSRMTGSRDEKLAKLDKITSFDDLSWHECPSAWHSRFIPVSDALYWEWPLLTDIFPWQENGLQFKRTWPIGETPQLLERRWQALLTTQDKAQAFKESRDRRVTRSYFVLGSRTERVPSITSLKQDTPMPPATRIAYRSLDRRWALIDNRLGDYLRPSLLKAHSEHQVYMTSLLTKVIGHGPSATAASDVPDMDHFCNRGGKDVIPLWRNREATDANVTGGVLALLAEEYQMDLAPADLFAYYYAILSAPLYSEHFWEELNTPGPRIPITKESKLFNEAVKIGRKLLWLHTYGERFVPAGKRKGHVPVGKARCKVGTSSDPTRYPNAFRYDFDSQELHVGNGIFEHVRPELWNLSVSDFRILESWLAYRMADRKGKKTSPLDRIRPERWEFDEELLNLLWVLDGTVDTIPQANAVLEEILSASFFIGTDFPSPTAAERKGPADDLPLFEQTESEGNEASDLD